MATDGADPSTVAAGPRAATAIGVAARAVLAVLSAALCRRAVEPAGMGH